MAVRLLLLLVVLAIPSAGATEPTPAEVVERSIAFHDPDGVWAGEGLRLEMAVAYDPAFAEKTGRADRTWTLLLQPGRERFELAEERQGAAVVYRVAAGESEVLVDGRPATAGDRESLGLYEPVTWRDYHEYMLLMPMKLRDPGTHLGDAVERVDFHGQAALRVRVTYDPEMGDEIWDYYFAPDTYALIGCRFHRKGPDLDGEYLIYEGLIEDGSGRVRLPRDRSWFYNEDGARLATDSITRITIP